ncbi:MAG: transcriptional regulator NrdR [Candidatus Dojkabacteria bacterium]|uniref:Transcriptional repressor NrdR n=1 Tax=Candidatus Dojkabacteria bacterium TaxID=2099670 RepID=A0A952AKG9_9BACT|nr:transcriptional repressor NrdR [Candidatus Dojkabacteria bacterium]WKZ28119.1 MAG: transcriptional regulator NrdR [Candidatus Dojkabacteria bacterium]
MLCPYCHSNNSKVVDKRDNKETGVTRRRRECLQCKKRFTTYERVETISLHVVKRSGKLEEFDREKLKKGIVKAVKKRQIPEAEIDDLIDDIELKLLNRQTKEIRSTEIGKMVLTRLKKLDTIGYLLFASVYRDFNSIKDFEDAIAELKAPNNID